MSHLPVLPIVLPAMTAGLLLVLGSRSLAMSRAVSIASVFGLLGVTAVLLGIAGSGQYTTYALSDWQAPFGILLVLDRLSALMVFMTALVALAAVISACLGWDCKGRHFHALFHFQLMGINGAFLTGDLFNLFVFFEVLLIASYCLLLHGLGEKRLRSAVHYVAINLTGSAVFLISVSLLYSVTGTLNMAHLAERVAQAPMADRAMIQAAGLMLLGVFGVKAAVFPLYFWLPAAYSSASAPVAALFAIMTKVGIYSVLRVSTVVFGAHALGESLTSPWLLPVALLTLALAAFGALGAKRLSEMVAYLTVASVGTMLAAIATGSALALSGALYYMAHSTLAVAAMFLLAELVARSRGDSGDQLQAGPGFLSRSSLSIAMLLGGAILAGLPLSSGFLGKLMILRGVADSEHAAWVWAVILGSSLMALIGLARAGSLLFWNTTDERPVAVQRGITPEIACFSGLIACTVLMVVFASPVKQYMDETAQQIRNPQGYIAASIGGTADRAPRLLEARR